DLDQAEGVRRRVEAGIVEQHVDAAEAFGDRRRQAARAGFVGDVDREGDRGLADRGRDLPRGRKVDVGDRDPRAPRGEPFRIGFAQDPPGAGDHDYFAVKRHSNVSLPSLTCELPSRSYSGRTGLEVRYWADPGPPSTGLPVRFGPGA